MSILILVVCLFARETQRQFDIMRTLCVVILAVLVVTVTSRDPRYQDIKRSMSEMEIDPTVTALFYEMKLRSVHKYAAFKILNKRRVVIDDDILGDPIATETIEEDAKQFNKMKSLLSNEPRYILYDFGFTNNEGRLINKLAFIFWISDDANTGDKFIYSSAKATVKKAFTGLVLEFPANDLRDLDYVTLMEEVEKKA
ncbi:uncharacterized protein LOC144665384 isoform X2 [Oculina patagonica]